MIDTQQQPEQHNGDAKPTSTLLWTAEDLANELRLSLRQIRRLDVTGKLPRPVKIGGRAIRWPRASIERWVQAGCPDRKAFERSEAESCE
jgi:predicted DNA-binding transcriptional regulator AlpA